MDAVPIVTRVNGHTVRVAVEPRRLLVELLRDELGLTGTKVSCAVQVCGVCTVLVDGLPVSACTYLAVDVDGCEVTTVEGLARGGQLSAVQRAFVEQSALQCGFCTPGFVVSVTALLADNPTPDEQEAREYLEGNLCRCTGYVQILAAVQRAAALAGEEAVGG